MPYRRPYETGVISFLYSAAKATPSGSPLYSSHHPTSFKQNTTCVRHAGTPGGGGATPRFWTPTTPPTKCWPEAPWGGGGGRGGGGGGGGGGGIGGGGLGRGELGGGVSRRGLGGGSGRVGWGRGGSGKVGGEGGTGSPYLPLPSL